MIRDLWKILNRKGNVRVQCWFHFTLCHLGARNSFTESAISEYVIGETQNTHLNQTGMEAAAVAKMLSMIYSFNQNELTE